MSATAGHQTVLSYDWEDGFKTAPASDNKKPFGVDATLTTEDASNNAVRLFEPGSPEAEQIIEQEFSGSWTAEFTLSNPWFLRGVITDASTSGTEAPYTHTFDGFPGDPMRLYHGSENSSTYYVLEGCVVTSATFTFNIPGTVDVTLEGAYADKSTGSTFTQPTINERALSFHDSTISRGGSTLSFVQSLSISVSLNADMIQELGSRFPEAYSPKQRNTEITYARIAQDSTDQERAYGGASSIQDKVENTADITVTASNGKSGSELNSMELQFTGVFPDSVSRSGIGDATSDLQDELSEMSPTIKAVAENSSSTAK